MPATNWEDRFRDPEFEAIWQRLWDAKYEWLRAWWKVPMECFSEEHGVFNPDLDRIPTGDGRKAAQEYLEVLTVYQSKIAEYPGE